MINLLTSIFIVAYVIRTVRMGLYLVFLWQLREYRWDRMRAHLASPLGRKLVWGKMEKIKWLAFVLFLFSFPVIWLLWVGEALWYLKDVWRKGWLHPVWTLKAIVLCLALALVTLGVPLLPGTVFGFLLLAPFCDRLLIFLSSLFVGVLGLISGIWKQWMFGRARKKRSTLPSLIVVGITGSYGKTSTKEYIATMLSQQYTVTKTPESKNADIGIARWILEEMDTTAQVAVVEMGILRGGELSTICSMAQPTIGVITGIGNQHLEVFGSPDALKKAKYELIASLPPKSTVVVNGNSAGAVELAQWAKRDGYCVTVTKPVPVTVVPDGIRFRFVHRGKTYSFSAPVLGAQAAENIVVAIEVALSLGLTMAQIKRGVAALVPVAQTMKPYTDDRGIWYIDDTFNASEQGVLAAVEYLKQFSGEKILVLTPLIELGDQSAAVHQRLGKAAGGVCDRILLTNTNFSAAVRAGVHLAKKAAPRVDVVSLPDALEIIRNIKRKKSAVVFEGKEAGRILSALPDIHAYES